MKKLVTSLMTAALLGVGLFMLTGKVRWLYWPVALGAVIAFGRRFERS